MFHRKVAEDRDGTVTTSWRLDLFGLLYVAAVGAFVWALVRGVG